MHGLSADRITFVDAYAKQLRMTPVTLKTMKNAKVEQTAPANLCNPTIFGNPSRHLWREHFSSHSMVSNVWDNDAIQCQGDSTCCYLSLNNEQDMATSLD